MFGFRMIKRELTLPARYTCAPSLCRQSQLQAIGLLRVEGELRCLNYSTIARLEMMYGFSVEGQVLLPAFGIFRGSDYVSKP
jgi:hypothetical protein